jgi:hypothetical protein
MHHLKPFLISMFLAAIVFSSLADKMDFPPLPNNETTNNNAIQRLNLWGGEATNADGRKIQLDLGCYYENTNFPPEASLITHVNGNEYVLWWVRFDLDYPKESTCSLSDNGDSLGLCFLLDQGRFEFYQIDIKRSLLLAKAQNGQSFEAGWLLSPENTNYYRQDVVIWDLPNMLSHEFFSVDNIRLHNEKGQWTVSFDVNSTKTPKSKYFYQSPVGGIGLTFLKKEVLTQEAEYNPDNEIKWRIALGAVFLLVAVPTFFVVRKIGRQKTAAATKP